MRGYCGACRFFNAGGADESSGGRCHFNPPTVTVYLHPGTNTPEWTNERPWVGRSDWCGRFESATVRTVLPSGRAVEVPR